MARLLAVAALCVGGSAVAGAVAPPAAAAGLLKGIWEQNELDGVEQPFAVYHDIGIRLFETRLLWAQTAPTRPRHPRDPRDPAYHWPASLADAIAQARRYGIRVMVMLYGSPRWANGGGRRGPNWAPGARNFADFAYAAARHYASVHLWMVWGEPNRRDNFLPERVARSHTRLTHAEAAAPERYARLLDAAYGQLKLASRRNLVIGGNTWTFGDVWPVEWVRYMRLPNGRPPRLDMYGHNPMSARGPDLGKPPGPAGSADFSDLRRFNRWIDRTLGRPGHRHIPLFLSEYSIPPAPDSEFNYHVTPPLQAQWITQAVQVAREVGAYALGWIHMRDQWDPHNGRLVLHSGLMFSDGTPKPGFYAFRRG